MSTELKTFNQLKIKAPLTLGLTTEIHVELYHLTNQQHQIWTESKQ